MLVGLGCGWRPTCAVSARIGLPRPTLSKPPTCLQAIVVGLPIGIVYLGLKALSFLLSLAMGVPFIANLAASVSKALGR